MNATTGKVSFDSSKLIFKGNDEDLLKVSKKYAASLKTIDSKLKIFVNDLDFDAATKSMIEKLITKFDKVELTDKAAADYWVNIFNQLTYLTLPNDDFRPLAKQIDLLKEVKKDKLETEAVMKKRVSAELLNQLEYLANWHHLDTLENADKVKTIQ
ncbi:MAG: hypothetical protein ACI9XO_001116 [Paraglaciecola sp.]